MKHHTNHAHHDVRSKGAEEHNQEHDHSRTSDKSRSDEREETAKEEKATKRIRNERHSIKDHKHRLNRPLL